MSDRLEKVNRVRSLWVGTRERPHTGLVVPSDGVVVQWVLVSREETPPTTHEGVPSDVKERSRIGGVSDIGLGWTRSGQLESSYLVKKIVF